MAGFKDDGGAIRHSLTRQELRKLYKELENFVADITYEEYQANKESLQNVFALIHQQERNRK